MTLDELHSHCEQHGYSDEAATIQRYLDMRTDEFELLAAKSNERSEEAGSEGPT